jgi:mannose-1-phosphate guanylyltransferase
VDRFFLVNGDTLTDVNLAALAADHDRTGALVTMALVPNPHPERYGGVRLGPGGIVEGFTRAGDPAPSYHFVGVQAAERSAFAGLPDGARTESVNGLYPEMIARAPGTIHGFVSAASFRDVGTPADYLATSLAVAAAEGLQELPVADTARVHPTARLTRTAVWDEAVVEARVELTDCIVGDGVRVPAGSRYRGMALAADGGDSQIGGGRRPAGLVAVPLDLQRLGGAAGSPG